MIARFWYDGIALEALQLAQIGCLPDSDMIIETTIDAGRTWQQHRLEDWINDHMEIFDASRRANRRRAGRWMEWIFTINPPAPLPQPQKGPEPMDINKLYPSRYLSPADLRGKSVRVTISSVTIEDLRNPRTGERVNKAVLHFAKSEKVMPLNKTQAFAMAELTGSTDTDAWPGHVVVVTAGRAGNGQQTIVITAPAQPPEPEPEQKAPPAGPASDSDADFDALPRAMDDPEHVARIK